jgi:hypothetical protein
MIRQVGQSSSGERKGISVDKLSKISPAAKHRVSWGQFADKLLWFLVASSAVYMASQIREVGKSIEQLNVSMAVVLYQMSNSKERLDKQDTELVKLRDQVLELLSRHKRD